MSEALLEPPVRSDPRLLLTIVIATAVHAMVVLGVRFTPETPVKSRFSAMEVMLVPALSPTTVVNALQVDTATDAVGGEPPVLPMAPVEKPVIATAAATAPIKPAAARRETINAAAQPTPAAKPAVSPTESVAAPVPSAAQLIERSLAIAATGAGLIEDKTVSGQSQSERTLYIKNNTRDWTEIAYSEALRNKAKHFGELLQHGVPSGRVGLDVAVATDGSLASVTITKSSGIEATDAEAIRIVEKAAPFAPLPAEMAKKFDVAHLEFTMNITHDEGFPGDH